MVLQVGEKLQNGKYTIEKRLGGGRFAILSGQQIRWRAASY